MKEILKRLFFANYRYFEVWNYLWLMSDNGSIEFTHSELCRLFNIPKSTLSRILQHQDTWNKKQIITRIERTKKSIRVVFVSEDTKNIGIEVMVSDNMPTSNPVANKVIERLYPYVKRFYTEKSIYYPEVENDRKFIYYIWEKIEKAMEANGAGKNPTRVDDNFKLFFQKIPQWWLENSFTLPTLNNKYNTIYQQIKKEHQNESTSKTNKKSNSYARQASNFDTDDYSFLVS